MKRRSANFSWQHCLGVPLSESPAAQVQVITGCAGAGVSVTETDTGLREGGGCSVVGHYIRACISSRKHWTIEAVE